jgi:biotin-dependent carboxylase-like uncharacterized protein
MQIEIVEPGLATTVQDRGRTGAYNVGIPPSGALDQWSMRVANLLVGNDDGAAVLEAAYLAPKLRFDSPSVVSVAGATCQVFVNGDEVGGWRSFEVGAGDVVSFGYLTAGARVYVAVGGGIDVPVKLGSRSTYGLGALGGFNGRPLQAGDRLPVGDDSPAFVAREVPESLRPAWSKDVELRIVLGLYDYRLTPESLTALLDSTWMLTPVADRTGFRYKGPQLHFKERVQPFGAGSDPSNIVDAGYPIGSIQVPSGAEPIILHRDAVSGGGYAQVGTVISVDMDLVGQSTPGTRTQLVPVTIEEAVAARGDSRARLAAVCDALS